MGLLARAEIDSPLDITDYIPKNPPRARRRPKRTRQELWRDYALYFLICLAFLGAMVYAAANDFAFEITLRWGYFGTVSAGIFGELIFASRKCWRQSRFWWKLCLLGIAQVVAFALLLLLFGGYMDRALWGVALAMDLCAIASVRRWVRRRHA